MSKRNIRVAIDDGAADIIAPTLDSVTITNPDLTANRTFSLTYGSVGDSYTEYCILENDTDSANCSWAAGTLPATYLVNATLESKTLSVWLRDDSSNTSSRVDSNTVTLVMGSYAASGSLGSVRKFHTVTLMANGKVLIAGGEDGSGFVATAEIYDPDLGTFTNTGALNTPRFQHSAIALPNGKVLIAGGYDNYGDNSSQTTSCELFDPATGTFAVTGNMVNRRANFAMALISSTTGSVLAAGGLIDNTIYSGTNAAETYNLVSGLWTARGNMPASRSYIPMVTLRNGTVLMSGGRPTGVMSGGAPQTTTYIYNISAGTFSSGAAMNTARKSHNLVLLPDGTALAVGGEATGSAEIYDPVANTWTPTTGDLVTPRAVLQTDPSFATLLMNGKVLIMGGSATDPQSSEYFDFTTGLFAPTELSVAFRKQAKGVALYDNRILLAGGADDTDTALLSSEIFSPGDSTAGTWTASGSQPFSALYSCSAQLPNGKILVAGGGNDDAYIFDPQAGTNTQTGSTMTIPRTYHVCVSLSNGKVLVTGGINLNTGFVTGAAELYDPVADTFTATGSMNSVRRFHNLVLLPNGNALVVGGTDGGVLNTMEIYNPTTEIFSLLTDTLTHATRYPSSILLRNGKVLITGGHGGAATYWDNGDLFDYTVADGAGLSVTAVTNSMSSSRYVHTSTLLPNGKVLIVAGGNPAASLTADLYNPDTNAFAATGSLAAARYVHKAVLLPTGKVLVVGGLNGVALSSSELYDPAAGIFSSTSSLSTAEYGFNLDLLYNGKVLTTGGSVLANSELYQ